MIQFLERLKHNTEILVEAYLYFQILYWYIFVILKWIKWDYWVINDTEMNNI